MLVAAQKTGKEIMNCVIIKMYLLICSSTTWKKYNVSIGIMSTNFCTHIKALYKCLITPSNCIRVGTDVHLTIFANVATSFK